MESLYFVLVICVFDYGGAGLRYFVFLFLQLQFYMGITCCLSNTELENCEGRERDAVTPGAGQTQEARKRDAVTPNGQAKPKKPKSGML